MVVQMVAIGPRIWRTRQDAGKVARFYEAEVDDAVAS